MGIEQPEPLARPTLSQVLDAHIQGVLEDVHTTSWGTIASYSASTQLANVQLSPRRSYVDDDGIRQTEQPAQLVNVPIIFTGSGASSLTFPINNGDQVLVLFAEHALGSWIAGGQSDFDPGDDRRFHLSDAVAIPGLRSSGNAISPAPPQNATVLTDPNQVRLGDQSASQAVVIQTALGDFILALQTAITNASPGGISPNPTVVTVLTALYSALSALNAGLGWLARTSKVKAN